MDLFSFWLQMEKLCTSLKQHLFIWVSNIMVNIDKVNIKYQGPKEVAPFHLLLMFENLNGFEMIKLTSKCIQTDANITLRNILIHLNVNA